MADKNKYYKITNWKGRKNFECLHCPFATLNRREITGHVDMHVRANLSVKAAEEAQTEGEPGDENYGLDVDPKGKKAKAIAKLAKKDAEKSAKEEKVKNA